MPSGADLHSSGLLALPRSLGSQGPILQAPDSENHHRDYLSVKFGIVWKDGRRESVPIVLPGRLSETRESKVLVHRYTVLSPPVAFFMALLE